MSGSGDGVLSPAFKGTGDDIEKTTEGAVGITWENRPKASKLQWFCLVIYIAIGGLFFVQGAMAVSSQNMMIMHPNQECPTDWWRRPNSGLFSTGDHWCMAPALKGPWDACQAKLASNSTLLGSEESKEEEKEQEDDEVKREDMWSILGSNVAVTATMFPLIVIFAVGWFFALKNFPFAVVYGTIGAGVAILVFLGIISIQGSPTKDINAGLGNFICAGGVLVFTFFMRKQISFICRVCAASCKILKLRLSIFAAAFVLKLIWACLISLSLWFLVASAQVVGIKENEFHGTRNQTDHGTSVDTTDGSTFTTCDIVLVGQKYQNGPMLVFLWISVFFDMALALVTAVGIGGYYFHRDDPSAPQYPAFTALGWAFTGSSGAVAESSMIVTLLRWAQQYLDFSNGYAWCCVCNPFWCILKVFWCFFASALETLSRFLIIMHGFHGGDFSTNDPRRPSKDVLQKHLGTGFVNGVVGQYVLSFSASLLAAVIGIGTHCWLDAAEHIHMFSTYPQLFKFVPIIYLWLADTIYKFGLATLVIVTMFWEGLSRAAMPKEVSCVLAGLFITFLSKIVFQWFVDVVFHATDGLLYCYVVDQMSGKQISEDMKEIHGIIQDSKGDLEAAEEKPIKATEGAEPQGYGAVEEAKDVEEGRKEDSSAPQV